MTQNLLTPMRCGSPWIIINKIWAFKLQLVILKIPFPMLPPSNNISIASLAAFDQSDRCKIIKSSILGSGTHPTHIFFATSQPHHDHQRPDRNRYRGNHVKSSVSVGSDVPQTTKQTTHHHHRRPLFGRTICDSQFYCVTCRVRLGVVVWFIQTTFFLLCVSKDLLVTFGDFCFSHVHLK